MSPLPFPLLGVAGGICLLASVYKHKHSYFVRDKYTFYYVSVIKARERRYLYFVINKKTLSLCRCQVDLARKKQRDLRVIDHFIS